MTKQQRAAALKIGRPSRPWPAEPLLGSYYGEEEIEAAVRVMREAMDPCVGFGFICEEILAFERAFADYCGTAYSVSVNGAGTGIDMALMALDLEPEDEVMVPAINFRAVPMAVLGQRAKLVLCEVDPVTLQADPVDVERRMTPRTRAIFPTHMNGMSFDVDAFLELAQRHPHAKHGPPVVIGDAARALGGGYKGAKIGSRGWMTVFSFHTQKNMTTLGEGGAITTDDAEVQARLRTLRQFGNSGECADYTKLSCGWGSNYKMTKVQAAVGLVQLGRLEGLVQERRRLGKARNEMLAECPGLQLPWEPEGYEHSYYLYSILVPKEWAGETRNRMMGLLEEEYGIQTVVANPPVQRSFPYIAYQTRGQELPVSDDVGQRLFCPPMHPLLPEEDNAYIAAAIWEVTERLRKEVPFSPASAR